MVKIKMFQEVASYENFYHQEILIKQQSEKLELQQKEIEHLKSEKTVMERTM